MEDVAKDAANNYTLDRQNNLYDYVTYGILLFCLALLHLLSLCQRSVTVDAEQLLGFALLSTKRALCFFQAPAGNAIPTEHVPARSCCRVLTFA